MAPGMEPYGSVNDFGPLITVACTDKWPDMRPVIRSSTEGVAAPPERGSQGKHQQRLPWIFPPRAGGKALKCNLHMCYVLLCRLGRNLLVAKA